MTKKFTSVEEYIASFAEQTQKGLEEVRAVIKSVAPDAVENISYQIAAFKVNGKNFVSIAGWKEHISIYPIPAGSETFNKQIAKYASGRGTLKFLLNEPLPLKLIEKAIKYKLADHLKNLDMKSK